MKNISSRPKARKRQRGYALLIVIFLVTLVLIASMSIGLRVLTQGRREKEQEMIWRGNQYVRGIKLYYRKFGRFPTSLDQLSKPSVGNLRFMREAYKDPMNKADGSWRLIYVGPAGQLIGSLKPHPGSVQMPGAGGQPGAVGTSATGLGAQPGATGGISGPGTAIGSNAPGTTAPGTNTGAQGTDTTGTGTDSQGASSSDTPTIVGGSIIGVGSKANHSSVIVYQNATNYHLFEFIWDPSKDMGIMSGPAAPIGTPAGAPGQNPAGPQPNFPNPQPNPLPPLSNPNPQQQ
jgi:hypothetical protein